MDKSSQPLFVEVLLPLAIPQTYTYGVPVDLVDKIKYGVRVEVPLRRKLYSGLVLEQHYDRPISKLKHVISVLDELPIIRPHQIDFWKWMAGYYSSHLGEVMSVALPSGLKLSSETKYVFNVAINLDELPLTDDEYLIAEALSIQHELTTDLIKDILDKKTVYPVIKRLMEYRVLYIKEELQYRYKAKTEDYVQLRPPYDKQLEVAMDMASRSEKQQRALLTIMSLAKKQEWIRKKDIYEKADIDSAVIAALKKKEIITVEAQEVSRLSRGPSEKHVLTELSKAQKVAHKAIQTHHDAGRVALLHGVTGSGKTRIYIELINKVLAEGGQVLLLLPEIALTTQIVGRLEDQVTGDLLVYHSKINDQKRVEIWKAALSSSHLFVGARSSLFLPFSDLKLIIIDEEHDPSFKQDSPSPRYNGRDSAIMLAHLTKAKVLLGSATPSIESRYNGDLSKYGYIRLTERYGESVLPEVQVVSLKECYKKGLMRDNFSVPLIDAIRETVAEGEQVILFQNRRGYAPVQRCNFCEWKAECPNCDVSLTYHQSIGDMKCHYCGFRQKKQEKCPDCGNEDMHLLGAGTERIEEVLATHLPEVRVARFDYDTTRSKARQDQILTDFKLGNLDLIVGTQMITKGFDFDHISLVGVVNADSLLSYPDFRAAERSFQLLVQVAGRAGRRSKPGRVIIQAFDTDHPVIKDVLTYDYDSFYKRELSDRQISIFPPYFYLIAVWLRHKDLQKTKAAAQKLTAMLKGKLGKRVQGPIDPPLLRVRGAYQQVIYVRVEKDGKTAPKVKNLISKAQSVMSKDKEVRQVRITVDVDPY